MHTCEKPNMGVCFCMAARMAERGPSAPAKALFVCKCASNALQAVRNLTMSDRSADAVWGLPANELARMQQISSCRQASRSAMPPRSVALICQIMIVIGSQTWTQVSQGLFLVGSADEARLSSELPCMCDFCMPTAETMCKRTYQQVGRGRLLDEDR